VDSCNYLTNKQTNKLTNQLTNQLTKCVVLEKDGEDQLGRSCEKWGSIT